MKLFNKIGNRQNQDRRASDLQPPNPPEIGQIGTNDERALVASIQDPVQAYGAEAVMQGINSKHELRILGTMSAGVDGFHNYQNLDANNLQNFVRQFPLPMDFEPAAASFLDTIEQQNDPAKRQEYEQAVRDLTAKIYGQKQVCWDQIKKNHEAERSKKHTKRGRMVMNIFKSIKPEQEKIFQPIGFAQLSKAQVNAGLATPPNAEHLQSDESCQDSLLVRPDQQLFGVFDGVGGRSHGRVAAQTAAITINQLSDQTTPASGRDLAMMLGRAHEAILDGRSAGCSTAVVAKIADDGHTKRLLWASIGDSRIYIVDRYGRAQLITQDEGEGNRIYNALGQQSGVSSEKVKQYGETNLSPGDRIVLCSDGITGDYGSDIMGDDELGQIVAGSYDAATAARNLMTSARKSDDRTAVVIAA